MLYQITLSGQPEVKSESPCVQQDLRLMGADSEVNVSGIEYAGQFSRRSNGMVEPGFPRRGGVTREQNSRPRDGSNPRQSLTLRGLAVAWSELDRSRVASEGTKLR